MGPALCSCLLPLLLLGGRTLRKFWLGNGLDLVLWSWPCGDKSDGEKRLWCEVKSSLAYWVSHRVKASFPGCGGQTVDPVTEEQHQPGEQLRPFSEHNGHSFVSSLLCWVLISVTSGGSLKTWLVKQL